MLLLTMYEWLGPGKRMTPEQREKAFTQERVHGFVTRLSLGAAIEQISAYQEAFNQHHLMAVNLRLVAVSTIEDLTDSQIEKADLEIVERLKQNASDFQD